MKSRMKCSSFFALIAFGFGYSDLLVRPCWAHFNPGRSDRLHQLDHDLDTLADALVMSLYEWLDSGGDPDDYTSSSSSGIPIPSGNSGSGSGNSGSGSGTSNSNVDYSDPPNHPTWSCALCGEDLNYMNSQSHNCSQKKPPGGNPDVSPELENNPKVEDD